MFRQCLTSFLMGTALLAFPSLVAGQCKTIVEVASETPELSSLVSVLTAAGLVDALNDREAELTVFAPTNEAFAKALIALGLSLEELVADTELLTDVLLYHVVPDDIDSTDTDDYPEGSVVETLLEGESLVLNLESGTVVPAYPSAANIIAADIEACESVVHLIDTVLVPFVPGESDDKALSPEPEALDM